MKLDQCQKTKMYDKKYSLVRLKPGPHFNKQFEYILRSTNMGRKKLKILDLGCGTGEYSLMLQMMGHEVIAVDLSGEAIKKAKEIGVTNAFVADLLSEPKKNMFDIVLVKGFSPLNTDDISEFIDVWNKIKNLLMADGVAIYWGSTNLTSQWSESGWFNWNPDNLKSILVTQVLFAFRYQANFPWVLNALISFIAKKIKLSRNLTFIGYSKKKFGDTNEKQ